MEKIDINAILNLAYIVVILIILIGIKMKIWTKSDFQKAKEITDDAIKQGREVKDIATDVAMETKFTFTQARAIVRQLNFDGLNIGKSNKVAKVKIAIKKIVWRLTEGGL